MKLGEGSRLVTLYALCGCQTNRIGLMRFSILAGAEDLETTPETFRKRLREVCQTFSWFYDSAARVLYIPSWWIFNKPENENVLKGILNDLGEVPDCGLVDVFAANIATLPETLRPTFQERCWERIG